MHIFHSYSFIHYLANAFRVKYQKCDKVYKVFRSQMNFKNNELMNAFVYIGGNGFMKTRFYDKNF